MKIDPSQINLDSAAWVKVGENPALGTITYELDLGDHVIRRTDTVIDEEIVRQNRFEFNESEGKSWGDGKIAARIPLAVWFDKLNEASQNGDDTYIKKWLNSSENAHWRTWKGNV